MARKQVRQRSTGQVGTAEVDASGQVVPGTFTAQVGKPHRSFEMLDAAKGHSVAPPGWLQTVAKPIQEVGAASQQTFNLMNLGIPGVITGMMGAPLESPQTPFGKGVQTAETVAALAPAGLSVAKATGGFFRGGSQATTFAGRAGLAKSVRNTVFDFVKKLRTDWEPAVDAALKNHPNTTYDLSTELAALKKAADFNPAITAQLQAGAKKAGSGLIHDLLADPSKASALTFEEAQAVKGAISNAPELARGAESRLAGQLADAASSVRLKQIKTVKALESVFKDYREGMDKYRLVRQAGMKPGRTASQIFGQGKLLRDPETRLAFRDIVQAVKPKSFETILGAARAAGVGRGLASTAGRVGIAAASGLGGYALGRKISGQ